MRRFGTLGVVLGVLSLTSSFTPAVAQVVQNSDSSGVGITNIPSIPPDPGTVSTFNNQVIGEAQQITNELRAARQEFTDGQLAEVNNPRRPLGGNIRRFERRSRPCNNCEPTSSAPGRERLSEARTRAMNFLESVKNPSPELLQQQNSRSRRTW